MQYLIFFLGVTIGIVIGMFLSSALSMLRANRTSDVLSAISEQPPIAENPHVRDEMQQHKEGVA